MSNEKARTTKTARAVTIRTYLKADEVERIVEDHAGMICTAVLAVHDKDVNDDGSPKVPHVHVNLLLDRSRELSGTLSWFRAVDDAGKPVQSHIEAVLDPVGCDDYLTHDTAEARAKGKYQYDESIVKVIRGDRDTFRAFRTDWTRKHDARVKREVAQDETEQMITDIIDGVSFREMARRYGRDYMKNCWTYRSYCAHIVIEETGDIDKALALEGKHVRDQLTAEAHREYVRGTTDGLRAVQQIVKAEIKGGATYLSEVSATIETLIDNLEKRSM